MTPAQARCPAGLSQNRAASLRKDRKLDEILNDCLERLSSGESIEDCAGHYPEYRGQLLPLLEVAAATVQAAASISYRPEAKARGLLKLTTAAAEKGAQKRYRWPPLAWRPRLAKSMAIALAIAVFTTGTAIGAGVASSDSVPGEPLYWLKTTRENISLMVPKSDMSRAQAHIRLARVRGDEMRRLVVKGRLAKAERMADRIAHHLNKSAGSVGITGPASPIEMPATFVRFGREGQAIELRVRLTRNGEILKADLLELRSTMPARERRRLDMLRHKSELRYRALIAALEGKRAPAWGPFWKTEPPRPKVRPRGRWQ